MLLPDQLGQLELQLHVFYESEPLSVTGRYRRITHVCNQLSLDGWVKPIQYLTFTRKDMKKQGPYLKMNPSLKGPTDVQALWKGLRDGTVDIVTSEHAPGERVEKEVGWTDIWKAWGGVPAIETMLHVLLSEGVKKQRISVGDLQRVCCENPAKIFGFYPKKGTIRKDSDADLVIVDTKKKRKVRAEELHYKVGWTPFEGWILKGWPILTMLRGQIIFEAGQVTSKPRNAQFLPMSIWQGRKSKGRVGKTKHSVPAR